MASALGRPAIPLLLDAIIHPSTAGKSRAIAACVAISSGATDSQLAEVYAKSVPATQESLHDGMKAAGRVEALKLLQLWKEPPPVKIREPRCVVLEGDLKSSKLQDRDAVWGCAGYAGPLVAFRSRSSHASGTGYRSSKSIVISTTLSMSIRIAKQILQQPSSDYWNYTPHPILAMDSNSLRTSRPFLPTLINVCTASWYAISRARYDSSSVLATFLIRNAKDVICSNSRRVSCIINPALDSGTTYPSIVKRRTYCHSFSRSCRCKTKCF
jgi:hypothetical protein